ncbi:MAG: maltose alpha-D-glucosyltransferase [Propioniciclava sp.]
MAPQQTDPPSPDDGDRDLEEVLPEISYDAQRYPSRPARLRPRAKRRAASSVPPPPFEADGRNPAYVTWLVDQSMLGDAKTLARQLAGTSSMWSNPYASPDPRAAVDKTQVWFTAYPLSLVTKRGQSFLGALGDPDLWDAFARVGIDAIHTGPVKLAGGISGWDSTPSVDGHFDRIGMGIDPLFGTEDEFRAMCEAAEAYGGTIIDDIVPGHTGKGADFRLAEINYRDYPGIYHMIDIPEEAWHLLPEVPAGRDSVNLSAEAEAALAEAGHIIGALQRVIFYDPEVKETNWSVTREVYDTTGQRRRWVYLHYFKEGQPSINWLDPTFAGMRLVMGDALHSLLDLGSGGLRLDANGFLGVEKSVEAQPAWSEGHPLSQAANQLIGSMVRKVGGFTFQELNLTIDDIVETGAVGPDLSYDFITRPAAQHAVATGDTEFLRLMLNEAITAGIDQASLVHALQNHDELTYELVHFETRHAEDEYSFADRTMTGRELAAEIRGALQVKLTGEAGPYNAVFTQNGIACTTTSVITASLGITDLETLTEVDIARIREVHLLLSMYNAFQPGVFALSGWDLVGALPLERAEVDGLIASGDTRWIERGAYDLLGRAAAHEAGAMAMPLARALYGPLPDQLEDPDSFAVRLATILAVRRRHGLATGRLIAVPEVAHPAVLVMVNELFIGATQVTVLNFSGEPVSTRVQSAAIPAGRVVDLTTRRKLAVVEDRGGFPVSLPPYGGRALIIKED